jgi:hypothetical protein
MPIILIAAGVIGIADLVERPRYQTYHTADIVQLIASGMCFGVALARLLTRSPKPPAA